MTDDRVTFNLPLDVLAALDERAKALGLSREDCIRLAVQQYLDKMEAQEVEDRRE